MSANRSIWSHPALSKILRTMIWNCHREVLTQPHPDDGDLYCNATRTMFGCWNYTLAGTTASAPCPPLPGMNVPGEHIYRECMDNGTWNLKEDYSACMADMDRIKKDPHSGLEHAYIFVGGHAISIVMLVISLFIFFRFSQLRCDRITIHKNLFISYVLTGLSWILYILLVSFDGETIHESPAWCIFLHIMAQYCLVSNFSWMFCEGLYLHTIMVKTFSSGKWVLVACYIIGWVWPLVIVTIYVGVRKSNTEEDGSCWISESPLQWIMYTPIIATMVANVAFLCNIVRLLITKLRQVPEATQTKKAARATLILIPLLGLQFLLIPMRPEKGSPGEDAYHYISALVISLQGAFVSTMYCFINSEVISVLKRKWYQHKVMFAGKRSRTSSTIAATTYTFVDHMSQMQTSIT